MSKTILTSSLAILLFSTAAQAADEPIFSGPQKGEKLTPFKILGVFDDQAEKEFDLVKQAGGKPVFLIFVHELTRPSVGLTRGVMDYAAKRAKDGLHSAVVFLSDDVTQMRERLKRARHAMPKDVLIGVSADGKEGPGAYGLNRNVTLTVLVGKADRVTANFALVQPSVQADGPKIGQAIVAQVGGKAPSIAELAGGRMAASDTMIRSMVAPVINKNATEEEVKLAAAKLSDYAAKHPAFRARVGEIARRIIDAGKLENYGTPQAQEFLKLWAKEFKPSRNPKQKRDDQPQP